MALDLSKLNFFSRLDARARVVVLFAGVLGIILLVYLVTAYFSSGSTTVGPSRVANAPAGMQSVPGGKSQSAEYQRALFQANQQRAEAAKMTGGSAVPTQINTGVSAFSGSCVICSDKSADVKNLLDGWVRQGKISPDDANALQELAKKKVSVDEYAVALDKLVRAGKITPEQARALLEEYKKQHTNESLNESAQTMDNLIKAGKLPLDAANQLLDAQRNKQSPSEYAALLQRMVKEGKISPEVAQQLLAQYTQQCGAEAVNKNLAFTQQMASSGSITPDVQSQLDKLTSENASVEEYSTLLTKNVTEGKLTPDAAGKLMDAYRQGKAACGVTSTIAALLKQAENDAYQEISDLLAAGKITPEVGAQLSSMIQNNVSLDDFKAAVIQMVQDKKLTPEISQLKIGDYVRVKQLRDAQKRLADLQANNASADQYADELKKAVAAGIITPEQAARLLQEYQASKMQAPITTGTATSDFAALQQKVAEGAATGPTTLGESDFASAQTQTVLETTQERQARLNTVMTSMSGQASQLISSWQPVTMEHREGSWQPPKKDGDCDGAKTGCVAGAAGATAASKNAAGQNVSGVPAIIKGGSILFAVLDTAINSDYPDSPVMATIVDGKYKGAKVMGKIVTTKGVSGQMDRVSLNFTLMNEDEWLKSKTITAYGIDPDTARTVMASTVDYHYMMRFGAMFATSFLQGYATAILNEGTSTTGIFGTSTQNPQLSPSNKLMVGLGQVGQSLGAATQNYINRPPTVRVDSGVSLGILFMTDVT